MQTQPGNPLAGLSRRGRELVEKARAGRVKLSAERLARVASAIRALDSAGDDLPAVAEAIHYEQWGGLDALIETLTEQRRQLDATLGRCLDVQRRRDGR